MLNLSQNELKLIAKSRGIKGYKIMSKDRLLRALNASELITKNKTIKDTQKYSETGDFFSKPTKAIKENSNADKILKNIRNLYMLEKKGINDKVLRDIRTLYESDEKDYYKPIRIGNAFSSCYIEYESMEIKTKCY